MGIEHRGFASMDPDRRRETARRGGRVAHQNGKAHEWTPEEARLASQRRWTSAERRSGDGSPERPPQDALPEP